MKYLMTLIAGTEVRIFGVDTYGEGRDWANQLCWFYCGKELPDPVVIDSAIVWQLTDRIKIRMERLD